MFTRGDEQRTCRQIAGDKFRGLVAGAPSTEVSVYRKTWKSSHWKERLNSTLKSKGMKIFAGAALGVAVTFLLTGAAALGPVGVIGFALLGAVAIGTLLVSTRGSASDAAQLAHTERRSENKAIAREYAKAFGLALVGFVGAVGGLGALCPFVHGSFVHFHHCDALALALAGVGALTYVGSMSHAAYYKNIRPVHFKVDMDGAKKNVLAAMLSADSPEDTKTVSEVRNAAKRAVRMRSMIEAVIVAEELDGFNADSIKQAAFDAFNEFENTTFVQGKYSNAVNAEVALLGVTSEAHAVIRIAVSIAGSFACRRETSRDGAQKEIAAALTDFCIGQGADTMLRAIIKPIVTGSIEQEGASILNAVQEVALSQIGVAGRDGDEAVVTAVSAAVGEAEQKETDDFIAEKKECFKTSAEELVKAVKAVPGDLAKLKLQIKNGDEAIAGVAIEGATSTKDNTVNILLDRKLSAFSEMVHPETEEDQGQRLIDKRRKVMDTALYAILNNSDRMENAIIDYALNLILPGKFDLDDVYIPLRTDLSRGKFQVEGKAVTTETSGGGDPTFSCWQSFKKELNSVFLKVNDPKVKRSFKRAVTHLFGQTGFQALCEYACLLGGKLNAHPVATAEQQVKYSLKEVDGGVEILFNNDLSIDSITELDAAGQIKRKLMDVTGHVLQVLRVRVTPGVAADPSPKYEVIEAKYEILYQRPPPTYENVSVQWE